MQHYYWNGEDPPPIRKQPRPRKTGELEPRMEPPPLPKKQKQKINPYDFGSKKQRPWWAFWR